jgi:acyl-CoA synthetase (AMP-forming)/AMP-acid ligase II/acyl carrier protein
MLSHHNLLHNERMIQEAFGQTAESVIVGWLPLYHDMGLIGNVIQPLFVGASCVLMSPVAFLQKPLRWLEAISRYRATTSGGPNFAYDLCVSRIGEEQRDALDLSSWEVAFNGSEPIRPETLERFATAFARCGFRREAFYPCYGLAEATLLVSCRAHARPVTVKTLHGESLSNNRVVEGYEGDDRRSLVGCGVILMDERLVIVDPLTLKRCAPGEVGEIWVSGAGIAKGYWNRPAETEHTFGARLADEDAGPFLRTGDLGFLLEGELFVTGRLKDLIIIRGLNHYPQDIELSVEKCDAALRPGCGAAFGIEAQGEERLVIVQEVDRRRQSDAPALIEKIRRAVADEHEVQAHAVVLIRAGSIPKTSSGKIQRHACREAFLEGRLEVVDEDRANVARDDEAREAIPATPSGRDPEAVAAWLRSLLAAKLRVEVRQIDFVRPPAHYGLDSLAAIEVTHGIEDALGVKLPPTLLLDCSSLTELAEHISARAGLGAPEHPIPATSADALQPLSRGQHSLWFMHQLSPGSTAYNITSVARLQPDVDATALRRALQGLVDRHAALRTTFITLDGKPAPRIHDRLDVAFDEQDVASLDEEAFRGRLEDEAHRAFDLERGPLLHARLFRRSAHESLLLISMHHIIADLWSLGVLIEELGTLYTAERAGAAAGLPPPALQYTDYARRQEEMLAGAEGERLWSYWQSRLAGELPALNLPTDRPRPPVQTYGGASYSFKLSAPLVSSIKAVGRAQGATLYMTLLAAFQTLLYRYTGQTDFTVGSPSAGRMWAELSGVVGYFVNPLVLRAQPSRRQTFTEFLREVRQTVLEALAHQEYPFALLVERLQPERDPGRPPLFQVMFALQKAHLSGGEGLSAFALGEEGARVTSGGLTLESVALGRRAAQFDLTLAMAEVRGELRASLEYSTDLFDGATIERMAAHLQTLLEGIASNPDERLSRLPLLTPAEREQLLVRWSRSGRDYSLPLTVQELFAQQVAKTPRRPAAVSHDSEVTYSELRQSSAQLAALIKEIKR